MEADLMNIEIIEDSTAKLSSDISLESLLNHIPGGIVMYRWDGSKLRTLYISDFFAAHYGCSLAGKGVAEGRPDFLRVHPDDLPGYKQAIRDALSGSHRLEYVYRTLSDEYSGPHWIKIDAVCEEQADGDYMIYAMYSDVTSQKNIEMQLRKNKASLKAAMQAANQLCFEYDPLTHTGECYTENNFFGIPKVIENCPESLIKLNLIHPDDERIFLDTARKMDRGEENSHCDIRIRKGRDYCWYGCNFNSYYDPKKERSVSILAVTDISAQVDALNKYQNHIHSLINVNEDAVCMGICNLTTGTFKELKTERQSSMMHFAGTVSYDEMIRTVSERMVDNEEKEKFIKEYSREAMLEKTEKGNSFVEEEALCLLDSERVEWLRIVCEFATHPLTRNVWGICYGKSIHREKLEGLLLINSLRKDVLKAAVIYEDKADCYLFDETQNSYCQHCTDFWGNICESINCLTEGDDSQILQDALQKEKVMAALKKGEDYIFSFNGTINGEKNRLEVKFSYLDKVHHLILAMVRNITDRMLLEKLQYDANHDPLTGIYNRSAAFRKSAKMIEKFTDEQFAIAHVDVKRFSLFNAFFGEKEGDLLLQKMAELFNSIAGDYEHWVYARIEADVFFVCFQFNKQKFERHVKLFMEEMHRFRGDFHIEPSVGVYFVKDRTMPIESMFARATLAAKNNKAYVLDAVGYYDQHIEKRMLNGQQIINDMNTALEEEQFEVYLQPKYELRTGRPTGAEALVRWIHPQHGMISPQYFIPIFENNGFIAKLDRYMWEHVCMHIRRWLDEGRTPVPVSVNVSRISMYSTTIVSYLKNLLDKYQISPEYLELELTESAYMDEPEEMKNKLRELRKAGFRILMDDFGSGYSSLNTLKEFTVDCLKLDMKFLSGGDSQRGKSIVSSVIRMTKLLGLPVIAEGVEKAEQADFLRSVGCEYVQGFLYARPMPVSAFEAQILTDKPKSAGVLKADIDVVGELVTASSDSVRIFMDELPEPYCVIGFEENRFVFIRTNEAFFDEFDMRNNTAPASQIFREHLTDGSYERLLESFAGCADNKDSRVKLKWHKDDGSVKYYLASLKLSGRMLAESIITATFTDLTGLQQ